MPTNKDQQHGYASIHGLNLYYWDDEPYLPAPADHPGLHQ